MKITKYIFIAVLFAIGFDSLNAQNLEENLQKVGPLYGEQYLQPLVNALGTDVNSNFFYTSYVPFDSKNPVQFNIGIRFRAMNTFLSSKDQKFNYSYSDTGIANGQLVTGTYSVTNAPTVIGDKTPAVAKFSYNGVYYPDNDIELIGGLAKTTSVPFVIPEITFGTVYATDASIILLPSINLEKLGKINMFGFTLRHNLSHYFKNSPIDYSIMTGFQKMSFTEPDNNDLWKSKTFFINGQVSKAIGLFTGYMGLQYENFNADVSYNYVSNGDKIPITINMDGSNKFRGIIGGTIMAGFFAFNLDANIGAEFALSCGFNFMIK